MVYVLDINNKPLMPTTRYGHVRILLRQKKAVVVRKFPFTIKLTYDLEKTYVQDVSLGVDCGTAHVGLSACSDKKELFAAEVKLRTDIVELLSTRRECRRTRRNKLRYRKARFLNRVKTKKEGWISPSVMHRVQCHLYLINFVHNILPVSEIHVEIGNFDAQKIKNPDIQGTEYQQGEQLGFWNVREYVLARDKHTCQHCKGKSKDNILNVHHIESRKTGGNSPSNLITLCETCHKKYHEGKINLKVKRGTALRDAAVMNIFKDRLYEELKVLYPKVTRTYGYITKYNRIKYNAPKTHTSDARMISKKFLAEPIELRYKLIKVRRHNRQLYKLNKLKGGRLKRNQSAYMVKGYRLFDVVQYQWQECYISGRRTSGSFCLRDSNCKLVTDSVSYKKLKLLRTSNGYIKMFERMYDTPTS